MEGISNSSKGITKKARFDEEKESRLLMCYHRFLSVDNGLWELVRQKLIHLKGTYHGKQAIQLCPICLTLFVSNEKKKHKKVSIGSLFFLMDPSNMSSKQIAEVFQQYGRTKTSKNGEVLVGVPSFSQICIQDHVSLEGSVIQGKSYQIDGKVKNESAKTKGTSYLQKRQPKEDEVQYTPKIYPGDITNNKRWKHSFKGGIKPLPIALPTHLESTPTKSTKTSARKENR